MDIGKRVIHLREAKGWTTNRLANHCGLSQSFLRSVELGEKGISVENLQLICATLGIALKEFFDFPDERDCVEDSFAHEIDALTPAQRGALAAFLKSLR